MLGDPIKLILIMVVDFGWQLLMIFKNDLVVSIEDEELCLKVLKSFFALVQTQFNKHVKNIRSDNGTKFSNTECNTLFKSLGIINESSFPHTP